MITINTFPDLVSLSGNRIPFIIQTDNTIESNGAIHYRDIQVLTRPDANDTITISWSSGNIALQFRFAASPNDSGLQIQDGSSFGNTTSWIDMAALPALQANALISEHFVLTRQSTDTIRLTAKAMGVFYNTTFAASVPGDWSSTSFAGVDPLFRPNFKGIALVQVRQKGAANYSEIPLELDPINNIMAFDLGPVLEADWYASPLPTFGLSTVQKFTTAIAQFYIRYAEQFGENRQTQKLSNTAEYHCLFGALSEDDSRQLNFYNNWIVGDKFLNRLPNPARIRSGATTYLWWYALENALITAASVAISFSYEDGDASGPLQYLNVANVERHALYCVPIRLDLVYALALPKALTSFEVWISQSNTFGTTYTEKRRFVIEAEPKMDSVQLVYKNGFGVYETFEFIGLKRFETETQNEFGMQPRNPSGNSRRSIHAHSMVTHSLELFSGLLNTNEVKQFEDLLASSDAYILEATFRRPVKILKGNATRSESLIEETYKAQVTIEFDITDKAISHA